MRRYDLYKKLERSLFPVYYKEITVTNNESSSLTGYQICIEIDDSSFLNKANPNKLLLVLSDNTVLPYWIEEWKHPSGKARIWTKIDLPASGKVQVRLFYGLSFDVEQNGDDVFLFFDDFDGDSLDLNKWQNNNSVSVDQSFLKFDKGSNVGFNSITNTNIVTDREYVVKSIFKTAPSTGKKTMIIGTWDDGFTTMVEYSSGWKKRSWVRSGGSTTASNDSSADNENLSCDYMKVVWHGSKVHFYFKKSRELIWRLFWSYNSAQTSVATKRITFEQRYTDPNLEVWIDWFFIKKFTANEPSISVGEEQKVLFGTCSNRIYINSKFSDYTKYMREITITNNSSSDLSNYQIYLELGGDFQYKANKNSLVITDSNGTILPYWVEDFGIGGKAKIWIPITLSGSATDKWYLYYGGFIDNPPNGDNVFLFFDDFDGDSLDTSKWTYTNNGTLTVANSFIKLETGTTSSTYVAIYRTETFSTPVAFGVRKFCGAYSGTSNDRGATFYTYDSTGDNSLHCTLFRYGHNYRIDHEVSGTWQGNTTLENEMKINTIYKLDCVFNGSSVKIDLKNDNNSLIATHTYSSFTFNPANIRLESYNMASSVNCEGDFDWIYIRKYISSEPTISVGSEIEYYKVW